MDAAGSNQEEEDEYNNYAVGLIFDPTDWVLILYLETKIHGSPLPSSVIKCADVYGRHPQQLKEQYAKHWPRQDEMFFFGSWQRKYAKGNRPARSTAGGYWKAAGAAEEVRHPTIDNVIVGYKRSLNFFNGKQPRGTKTTWIMQEFFLHKTEKYVEGTELDQSRNNFVCKIYQSVHNKRKDVESKSIPIVLDPLMLAATTGEAETISEMTKREKMSDGYTELVVPPPARHYKIPTYPATYCSGPNHRQREPTMISLGHLLNPTTSYSTAIRPCQAYNSIAACNFSNYVPDNHLDFNVQFSIDAIRSSCGNVKGPRFQDGNAIDGVQQNLDYNFQMKREGTAHPIQAHMNPPDQQHYCYHMNSIQTGISDGQQLMKPEDVELPPLPPEFDASTFVLNYSQFPFEGFEEIGFAPFPYARQHDKLQ